MGRDPRTPLSWVCLDVTPYRADDPLPPFFWTYNMYLGTETLSVRLASAISQALVNLHGSDIGETPGAPELDHRRQLQKSASRGLLILSLPSMTTAVP